MNTKTSASLLATSALAAIALAGCATTDPGPGADAQYRMPHTDVKAALALTLESCPAKSGDPKLAEADVTLSAVQGARPEVWTLPGKDLISARVKRDIEVTTTTDGNAVITGVNATNTDRTGAIVGNVFKIVAQAASIAGAAAALPAAQTGQQPPIGCKVEVADAIARAGNLTMAIAKLRSQLSDGTLSAKSATALNTELNSDAVELAALRTGILHVDTSGTLVLGDKPLPAASTPAGAVAPADSGGALKVADPDPGAFDKWFDFGKADAKEKSDFVKSEFGLGWTATLETANGLPVYATDGTTLDPCTLAMWVPSVVPVKVSASAVGAAYPADRGKPASQRFPISQWAPPVQLCLSTGFGENRTVNLTFDPFGEATTTHWMSDASAENATGALAGAAPDAVTVYNALHPGTTAQQKTEIDALQTQQTLNQLKACKAVIEAGGYQCPTATAP